MTAAGPKVLMAGSANIRPALRLEYALRIRTAWPRTEELSEGAIAEPRSLLPPQFGADMDLSDFLFTTVVQHIRGSQDSVEMFQALDGLAADVRNRFVDAISAVYSGPAVLVNSGWSHDQINDGDMSVAMECYDRIATIVSAWGRPDLEVEAACARSVILDEGLKRPEEAIAATDDAISKFGSLPALVRQKSKVLGHTGRHLDASELLQSIEDLVGLDSPLERALALRDGGVSAAEARRFIDAIRLFDKARDAINANPDSAPLASALLVEKALALWRGNNKPEALIVAGDALDAVEAFPHDQSRQAERSHQFARAIVGLFFSEPASGGNDTPPAFTFGQASALESSSTKLLGVELKPLADNWRVLAAVEADLGSDAGIDARSMTKQAGPLSVTVEQHVRALRYAASLESGDLERALRAGLELVNAVKVGHIATTDANGLKRADAAKFVLGDPKSLAADAATVDAIQSILLDILAIRTIERPIDEIFLAALDRVATAILGHTVVIDSVIRAAADSRFVRQNAGRAEMLARGMVMSDEVANQDPSNRFYRDMMMVGHLAFSLARSTLASQAAPKISRGWRFVIDQQRFRLRNPRESVPAMEAAIAKIETNKIAATAELLLGAADAVEHQFADGWIEILKTLKAVKS